MGWIAACILIAVLLPLLGFLYVDILEVKHESKTQLEKVEKLSLISQPSQVVSSTRV